MKVLHQTHLMWCAVGSGGGLLPSTVRRTKREVADYLGSNIRDERIVRCAVEVHPEPGQRDVPRIFQDDRKGP